LKLLRNGEEKQVSVKLGELPSDDAAVSGESKQKLEDVLGFKVAMLSQSLASRYNINASRKGVIVTSIDRSGAAFRSGLKEGDLIISVDKKDVSTLSEFEKLAGGKKKGDTILLLIERQGSRLFVAFSL
ncbi:MAG: PDZ domain-containing protein, partial [Chlorobiales bacterium]|nr:PDZ domain-containing protein [Chlorobiales bacterium]